MRFFRYLAVAIESILAHKLRALLTMLGIIIGVASVTTTIGMGQGLERALVEEVEGQGINLISIFGLFGEGQALTSGDATALADVALHPEIEAVAPTFELGARVVYEDKSIDVQVKGTTASYEQVHNLAIASGRFFTEDEVEGQQRLAVISDAVARTLFTDTPPVGQMIRVGAEPMRVVGVLAQTSGGLFGGGAFQEIYVPIDLAQARLARAPRYRGEYIISEISVQATSSELIRDAEYRIERTLRLRHNLEGEDVNDFFIFSQQRGLEFIATITGIISAFLGSIGAVSLLVGGIGIMNIMLVSVTERTKEIGLRKALGAQDSDILLQFLIEAVMLTIFGGAIGVGLSYGVGAIIGLFPNFPFQVFIGVSAWLLAISVSAGCGLIFGLYPAIRATRLDPIEALRYE